MEPGKRRRKKIKETGLTYKGYPCTKDCMGHHAGHEWATHWGIQNPEECPYSTSNSFWEGCKSKAEEQEPEELEEMAGQVHGGIRKVLKDKGYKYLGGGIDKHVFLEPGTGYAFIVFGYRPEHKKGFSPDQQMFADWVRYCKKNSNNPHLPRFSGMESFNFQGQTYIQCRMEHLKEAPKRIGPVLHYIADYADTLGGQLNYEDVITDMLDAEGIDYSVEQVVEYLGGPESAAMLIDTVNTVMQFGMNHEFNIDLHAGNYMQRPDGTIVVNDPFVVWLNGSYG